MVKGSTIASGTEKVERWHCPYLNFNFIMWINQAITATHQPSQRLD